MAAGPFWKGYLKLSLVICPVARASARGEKDKLRFHTLNRATSERPRSRYVDAESGRPVDPENEVKGLCRRRRRLF